MGERVSVKIPLFLAKSPHTKTAIALPELVRQTNAFSKKWRGGCSPALLDSNPKALFLHYNVKCHKKDSDPGGHDVRVQFDVTKVQESQKAKDLDIEVSCSCPAFLYWGAQWNLHQRDGLLGIPRPELVAPTERLDLRGNFVICKHIHAVFERILPSVQHNIVKILRDREVERNKEKAEKTPERLKTEQDRMKKKKELQTIRETKNKEVQEKLIEALRQREEARMLHEQELDEQAGEPGIERDEEATEGLPEEDILTNPAEDQELADINELTTLEEQKLEGEGEDIEEEEKHDKGSPHLHSGLPYKPEDVRGKGWKGERLSHVGAN